MAVPKQKQSSELERLLIDQGEEAIDTLIAAALEPLLGITRDGKVITKPPFLKLPLPARVLAVTLAYFAALRLGAAAKSEVTSAQLEHECLAPSKACRECLSRLKSKNLLAKNEVGYFIPIWAAAKAVEEIQNNFERS